MLLGAKSSRHCEGESRVRHSCTHEVLGPIPSEADTVKKTLQAFLVSGPTDGLNSGAGVLHWQPPGSGDMLMCDK